MAVGWTEFITQTSLRLNLTSVPLSGDVNSLRAWEVFAVVLMSVVIIVAFHGNLFIIIVIIINPQLRSSMANIFIINLCVVDLLASVLAIPLSVATFVDGDKAMENKMCEVSGFLNTFSMVSSMLSLCVISVERFYSITVPMHHAGHATPCLYILSVITVWAIAIILSALPWFELNSYRFRPPKRICSYYWQGGSARDQTFVILIFTVSFLIPSIILVTMYVGIFRVARKAATHVGPHPNRTSCLHMAPGGDVPAPAQLTTRNITHIDPIFSISSTGAIPRAVPQINIERIVSENNSELTGAIILTESRKNAGTRTAEVTGTICTHSNSRDNNNVKVDGSSDRKSSSGEQQQHLTCSKLFCVCKKAGFNCLAGPSISGTATKCSNSNLGQQPFPQRRDKLQPDNIPESISKHNCLLHDSGRAKTSHTKALRTLLVIVVSYFVLWSPYFVCQIYGLTHGKAAWYSIELAVTWISFSSYAVNPCLYGLMNRLIRDELRQLMRCLCCGCNHSDRTCRHPCMKLPDEEELGENGEMCLGGAESFYQFLQRTQASDVSPPVTKSNRSNNPVTQAGNVLPAEINSNNVSSGNQSNCVF